MTPEETVRLFCKNVSDRDPATIAPLLADNIVFMNVGLDCTHGRAAVIERFNATDGYWATFPEAFEFLIKALSVSENRVYTERIDIVGANGITARIPVLGVLEVTDGVITLWRDYADMSMAYRLIAGETPGEAEGYPSL